MSVWAIKANGAIIGVFAGPQDPEAWPDIVELANDDLDVLEYCQTHNVRALFPENT